MTIKNHWLWIILSTSLLIRLVLVISTPTDNIFLGSGGDEYWYLANGAALYQPEPTGTILGLSYATNNLPIPPLYLMILGGFQQLFSFDTTIVLVRIMQSILSVLMCYLAYDLAKILTNDERAGLVTAIALTFSISFSIEVTQVLTETVYMTFIMLGIWVYCRYVVKQVNSARWYVIALVGAILGLATMTRAVGILFPLGVAIHLLLIGRHQGRRIMLMVLSLFLTYGAVISTWTIYNWVSYERFVIVSDQFMPSFWRGVTSEDGSPSENDELLGNQTYTEQTTDIILSDPMAVVQRRVGELTASYLQPHGTIGFGSTSLKQLALTWVRSGFGMQELNDFVQSEGFLIKLVIYIWHYTALLGGLIGMWLTRKNWRISLVIIGFIVYTTLLHLVVLALPRYIFPTYPFFWILASVTLVTLWDAVRVKLSSERA